jgi:hypothetical protein
MTYTAFDPAKPDAATQNGTQFAQSTRDNFKALRDAGFFGGDSGWTYSQSGGTASEPTTMLWSKGTERIRITATWGTTSGENGNLTAATIAYSSNSGGAYDTIEARTMTYDSSGNFTGGKHTLAISKLMGLPGIVKQQLAAINALTVSAGTGLSGGGAISGSPTLSFNTSWGDARYATLAGATFTGNIVVKTASHTIVTPGALAVDWTASDRQTKSISANSTFTFTAPAGPANLMLKVVNTSGSSVTLTWPAAVKWSSAPPAHAGSKTGLYMFWYDGTTYWGSYIQGYAN